MDVVHRVSSSVLIITGLPVGHTSCIVSLKKNTAESTDYVSFPSYQLNVIYWHHLYYHSTIVLKISCPFPSSVCYFLLRKMFLSRKSFLLYCSVKAHFCPCCRALSLVAEINKSTQCLQQKLFGLQGWSFCWLILPFVSFLLHLLISVLL